MVGALILDKPHGLSSHQSVQRARRLLGERRIGHLGTLDPIGTGVLPLMVGPATRLARFFLGHEREYEATIRAGFTTSTYDSQGEITSQPADVALDEERLNQLLKSFQGSLLQVPPPISAKKIEGVRAYRLARSKRKFELKPAAVEIYDLQLLGCENDEFRIRLRCSAGTYVRSLAHDFGRELGVGAHVTQLRRTAMGEFRIAAARTFEELQWMATNASLHSAIVPASDMLGEIPNFRVDEEAAARISRGQPFEVRALRAMPLATRVKAFSRSGELLAIGEMQSPWKYHPTIVFR